ncbi:unnamed protein product [Trichogramma brassicae]|uniref:Uncharacterized protein n=1 Tax=Trichogramma brassicae TaxID=86971 RepID=A0A6H5J2W2_9HYME|nr:unnamed protein product [Trichogramma brassicae]
MFSLSNRSDGDSQSRSSGIDKDEFIMDGHSAYLMLDEWRLSDEDDLRFRSSSCEKDNGYWTNSGNYGASIDWKIEEKRIRLLEHLDELYENYGASGQVLCPQAVFPPEEMESLPHTTRTTSRSSVASRRVHHTADCEPHYRLYAVRDLFEIYIYILPGRGKLHGRVRLDAHFLVACQFGFEDVAGRAAAVSRATRSWPSCYRDEGRSELGQQLTRTDPVIRSTGCTGTTARCCRRFSRSATSSMTRTRAVIYPAADISLWRDSCPERSSELRRCRELSLSRPRQNSRG